MVHKTISLKTVIAFCFLIFTSISCATDDDNQNDTNDSSQSFFAKVNDVDYNPEFISGFETEISNALVITGAMGDGEQIQIFLTSTTPAGTYDFADNTNITIQAYYQGTDGNANDVAAFATSGSIVLNSLNTSEQTVTGSFNFSGIVPNTGETFSITNGTFNISYEKI